MRQSKKGSKRKSLPKLKKELQEIFNEFIRLRDKGLPCISCNKNKVLQAGHFFPVKLYDNLRYDEDNVHGEDAGCNCFNQAHLIYYAINLKEKIGEERFNALYKKAEDYKKFGHKWSRTELEEKIIYYTEKVKQLKQEL
jgi:hypothetical protein